MSTNLPANISTAIAAMETTTSVIDSTLGGDFTYLRLTKAGEWIHGADEDEINPDSVFAVDTGSFCKGFQAWDDGDLEGEEIRLLTDPPVTKAELESGLDWKPLLGFQLLCIDGPDKGAQLIYKTTSRGGIDAVNRLMKEIVAQAKDPDNDGKVIPTIQLDNDSYRHKKYGKIYTPVLDVVGWIDAGDLPATDATPDEPVAEPEPEPDEPTRRRRRRA